MTFISLMRDFQTKQFSLKCRITRTLFEPIRHFIYSLKGINESVTEFHDTKWVNPLEPGVH